MVTTAQNPDLNYLNLDSGAQDYKGVMQKTDRIFIAAGKGARANITELRYGLEARIGLEMEYGRPITRAWGLPPNADPSAVADGVLILLSLPDSSALLQLTDNAADAEEITQEATTLDLGKRTIVASVVGQNSIIQVTEQSIVVLGGSHR